MFMPLVPSEHNLRDSVGTTSCDLLATRALPDARRVTLDGVLSAEGAGVLGVLGDFHLLHTLSQGGTVTMAGQLDFHIHDLHNCMA